MQKGVKQHKRTPAWNPWKLEFQSPFVFGESDGLEVTLCPFQPWIPRVCNQRVLVVVPQSPSQLCLLESVSCSQTPRGDFSWLCDSSLESGWLASDLVFPLGSRRSLCVSDNLTEPELAHLGDGDNKSPYLKGLPVRVRGESSSKALGIVPDTPEWQPDDQRLLLITLSSVRGKIIVFFIFAESLRIRICFANSVYPFERS